MMSCCAWDCAFIVRVKQTKKKFFPALLGPEDKGTTVLPTIHNYDPNDTALNARRFESFSWKL
jgi:hypothetical protein